MSHEIQRSTRSAAKSTNNANTASFNEKSKYSSSKTKASKDTTTSIKRKISHLSDEEEGIKSLSLANTRCSKCNKTSNDTPPIKELSHLLPSNESSNEDEQSA